MHDLNTKDSASAINMIGEAGVTTLLPSHVSDVAGGGSAYLGLSIEPDVTDVVDEDFMTVIAAEPANDDKLTPISAAEVSCTAEYTADGRPIIYIVPGQLRQIMRDAERLLAGTGRHFQRGGSIVVARTDAATSEAVVTDLHPLALVHALDGVSAWMRYEKRGDTWGQVDPPERLCNVMVRVGEFHHLPSLNGIARQPFLRPDGSLCQSTGHDLATGLCGMFDADEFDVPTEPTREQAQHSLAMLDDLLTEFEFALPHDRSAALSAMLTAAIRPSLPLAPLFHVRAPQIASGKSYLCEILTALATPRRGTPVGFPARDEECTKLLLAQLARSPAVIEFDNLIGDLKPHKSLCTALTSGGMEGRILGHSKVMIVGTRTLFLSSGNNVGPIADMTRRCLTVNLNPSCEVPATRTFKRPHLIAEVLRERGRYVSAALTVVRAWIEAGRPESPCPPVANFVEWSDLCRQPLLWLGQPDPAASIFESMAEDPDRQMLGLLLSCWHDQFGDEGLLVREFLSRSTTLRLGSDELNEVLLDITGDRERVSTRKLGRWIARRTGRVVGGLRFVKTLSKRNSLKWRVESVESVKTASAGPTEIGSIAHE